MDIWGLRNYGFVKFRDCLGYEFGMDVNMGYKVIFFYICMWVDIGDYRLFIGY